MAKEARPYWNGHIRLSLITFPVRLYAAVVEAEKVRLHKIERKTGKRIHYQNITDSQRVVEPDDIVKGYEYEKNRYIPIENDEIKKLRVESTHMIDIVQFTDLKDIDAIYFERPFYVVPDNKMAQEAYITLRDALRETHKIALGQITIAGKERISAIKACGKGLVLETLRYEYEIREASDVFKDIPETKKIPKDQMELAEQLIKKKTAAFDPKDFKDTYQEGLLEIIDAKLHHRKIIAAPKKQETAKVVNIMDALKRSLEQSGGVKKKKPKTKKAVSKKTKPAVKKRKAG